MYVASVAPELIRAPLDPEDPGPIPAKLKASAWPKLYPLRSNAPVPVTNTPVPTVPAPIVPRGEFVPFPATPNFNVPALIFVTPV